MEDGIKVKINDKTFRGCLSHLNEQVGKVSGKGRSGETIAVDLTGGGRCFVEPANLTAM